MAGAAGDWGTGDDVWLDRGCDAGAVRTRWPGTGDTIEVMFAMLFPETGRSGEVFDAWQLAARDARLAWEIWVASDAHNRGAAYAGHRASLDREERAAELLAEAVRNGRR